MNTTPSHRGAPLHVATWGETVRHGGSLPGAVRLVIGGQDAGSVYRAGSSWAARVTGETAATLHATAGDALTAVVLSPRGRRLGWRAASRMTFTLAASQVLTEAGRA